MGENLQEELIQRYLEAHFPSLRNRLGFVAQLMQDKIRQRASAAQKSYNSNAFWPLTPSSSSVRTVVCWLRSSGGNPGLKPIA